MRLDKYGNPIFNSTDVLELLYNDCTSVLSHLTVDKNTEIQQFESISGIRFNSPVEEDLPITEYDELQQKQWFMPDEYYTFDIKTYCLEKCILPEEIQRINEEYAEFQKRGLVPLLQWLKFFVDTCIDHGILWGVGRGSSVASYLLYLLGVHKINSIKYNLDWKEFLR